MVGDTNARGSTPFYMEEAISEVASADTSDREIVGALVARARDGDADAFGQIYDRYHPDIYRYFVHHIRDADAAEDLAQQVFLKAWQAIPRYQDRGAPLTAWLYRMAHNQMVDYFRTRRPSATLEGVDVPEAAEAEDRVLTMEANATLREALDRLSPDHREVLVLRFLMEKSAAEIGQVMGRKEVTVRGLQLRALRALRRELEAEATP